MTDIDLAPPPVDLTQLASYDYDLPDDLIAQHPIEPRDAARLLVLERTGGISDHQFFELPELLRAGDLLVVNTTKVRRARMHGTTERGGTAELFLVEPPMHAETTSTVCLVRPFRRLHPGDRISMGGGLTAVIGQAAPHHPGARYVTWDGVEASGLLDALEAVGEMPLPPYIHEVPDDEDDYQTVYASGLPKSAAAPTAGLHFTDTLLERVRNVGIELATVDLTVGMGTFLPIREPDITKHPMHTESFTIGEAASTSIRSAHHDHRRVIAVGTTTVRALEHCVHSCGEIQPFAGSTNLFLRPGVEFGAVDGIITNFHQPCSTLAVLVAAAVGYEQWKAAYAHAVAERYRFFSFGDAMLCWTNRGSRDANR